ncbi:MAG: hypothetical protein P8Y70_04140 [Candidatus Lokiarchaeota archaeon]
MKSKKINLGDLIFILIYKYGGEIKGSTTLQKLIDIIRLDSELEIDVDFSPYEYGDFSQQLNDTIQVYLDNSWLIKEEVKYQNNKKLDIFKLTDKGNKIAETLFENLLTRELKALEIVNKFINKSQIDLIAYSYFWYPKTAIRSKIKKEIFKRSSILPNLEGELEEEYFSITKSGRTIKKIIQESWKC